MLIRPCDRCDKYSIDIYPSHKRAVRDQRVSQPVVDSGGMLASTVRETALEAIASAALLLDPGGLLASFLQG